MHLRKKEPPIMWLLHCVQEPPFLKLRVDPLRLQALGYFCFVVATRHKVQEQDMLAWLLTARSTTVAGVTKELYLRKRSSPQHREWYWSAYGRVALISVTPFRPLPNLNGGRQGRGQESCTMKDTLIGWPIAAGANTSNWVSAAWTVADISRTIGTIDCTKSRGQVVEAITARSQQITFVAEIK
ncbi:hypothetical protein F5Y10DRAFT_162936 [Nemania abortiva]|nr:hypothetical protein F5Y10DRAFT_162936 [Nemania abortiva]